MPAQTGACLPRSKGDITVLLAQALHINVRTNAYGSVAEIGAGQEVARWLFKVGGAAGTVGFPF